MLSVLESIKTATWTRGRGGLSSEVTLEGWVLCLWHEIRRDGVVSTAGRPPRDPASPNDFLCEQRRGAVTESPFRGQNKASAHNQSCRKHCFGVRRGKIICPQVVAALGSTLTFPFQKAVTQDFSIKLNGNYEICLTGKPSVRVITELLIKLPYSWAVKGRNYAAWTLGGQNFN